MPTLQIKQLYKAVVKESHFPFTKYRHSSKNDIKRGWSRLLCMCVIKPVLSLNVMSFCIKRVCSTLVQIFKEFLRTDLL